MNSQHTSFKYATSTIRCTLVIFIIFRIADDKNVPALEAEDDNKSTENRLAEPTRHSIALILGALISAASLVVVGVVAIVVVILRKRRSPVSSPASSRRPKASGLEDFELREDVDHGFGEGFQRRSNEWRERNVRASLYLHDADGRPAQHITIGNSVCQLMFPM